MSSALESFNFSELQLRHPDAFFCKLGYSRFKFVGTLQNIRFILATQLFIIFSLLCCTLLSLPFYQQHYFASAHQAMNAGAMLLLALFYLYVWWYQTKVKFSSHTFAKRLQRCLYILIGIFTILAINFYWLNSEIINVITITTMTLTSVCAMKIEPNFKNNSRAVDWVKLQKIRQLGYWSYLQYKSKHPQIIEGHNDLKSYYLMLHNSCLIEEQKLLIQICHKSWKDSFLE